MTFVLLDTSFILTCVKQKIDFFNDLYEKGFKIIIPIQVIHELEGLSRKELIANLALTIIQKNEHKQIDLNTKNTDEGIISFAKKYPEKYIATLDSEIKNRTKNKKIVIRSLKNLEVV